MHMPAEIAATSTESYDTHLMRSDAIALSVTQFRLPSIASPGSAILSLKHLNVGMNNEQYRYSCRICIL